MSLCRAAILAWGSLLFLSLAVPSNAQQSRQDQDPCAAPEYHQMDFVLGHWTILDQGKPFGEVTIERTSASDCGLAETVHLVGGGGGNGQMGYSRAFHGWVYLYTASTGLTNWLHDARMLPNGSGVEFTVTRPEPAGGSHQSHFSITKIPNGTLRVASIYVNSPGKKDYDYIWTKK